MATYNRVKVKIDSTEFRRPKLGTPSRNANQVGRRVGDSVVGRATLRRRQHPRQHPAGRPDRTLEDCHGVEGPAPQGRDHLVSRRGRKVLDAVEFMGWVSVFEVGNPPAEFKPVKPPSSSRTCSALS